MSRHVADGSYQSAATSAGSSRLQILSPAAELGDVARAFDGMRLTEKATDLLPIFQINFADAERRGNTGDEAAEMLRGDGPPLHIDGRTASRDAHQPWPERWPAG